MVGVLIAAFLLFVLVFTLAIYSCNVMEERDNYKRKWEAATRALEAKDEQIDELTAPKPPRLKAALTIGKRNWEWY